MNDNEDLKAMAELNNQKSEDFLNKMNKESSGMPYHPAHVDREDIHTMKSQGIEIKGQEIVVNVPKGMTVIQVVNNIIEGSEVDTNLISDGYHTFGELYEHRIQLFIALCKLYSDYSESEALVTPSWITKAHSDGSVWEGWFILGIHYAKGQQITYHLPIDKWEECKRFSLVLDKAPEWDGHTSADVLERLKIL